MKIKLNFFKRKTRLWVEIVQEIFEIAFMAFVIFYAIDYFLPGFITNWFSPIWLLILALISGIIANTND
ncbi:MAG: hypothetical protein WC768_01270 [Patescibacteria group bacterium]|jgi:TRAP-type C4-dicarboxylate transport system permease small subunit